MIRLGGSDIARRLEAAGAEIVASANRVVAAMAAATEEAGADSGSQDTGAATVDTTTSTAY